MNYTAQDIEKAKELKSKGCIIQLCTKYDCAYSEKAIDRLVELENKKLQNNREKQKRKK